METITIHGVLEAFIILFTAVLVGVNIVAAVGWGKLARQYDSTPCWDSVENHLGKAAAWGGIGFIAFILVSITMGGL